MSSTTAVSTSAAPGVVCSFPDWNTMPESRTSMLDVKYIVSKVLYRKRCQCAVTSRQTRTRHSSHALRR